MQRQWFQRQGSILTQADMPNARVAPEASSASLGHDSIRNDDGLEGRAASFEPQRIAGHLRRRLVHFDSEFDREDLQRVLRHAHVVDQEASPVAGCEHTEDH